MSPPRSTKPVRLECPACYERMEVPFEERYSTFTCPRCGRPVQLANHQIFWTNLKRGWWPRFTEWCARVHDKSRIIWHRARERLKARRAARQESKRRKEEASERRRETDRLRREVAQLRQKLNTQLHRNPPKAEHGAVTAVPANPTTSGLAVASFVLALFGFFFSWFCGGIVPATLALILGAASMSATSKNPALRGRGLAVAGVIIAILDLVGWTVFLVLLSKAESSSFGQ